MHHLEIIERLIRDRRLHGTAQPRDMRLWRRLDGPQPLRLDGGGTPDTARNLEHHFLEQHARQHRHAEASAMMLGLHMRVGIEDNIWDKQEAALDID